MSFLATILLASAVVAQQAQGPLVRQTELPPPAAIDAGDGQAAAPAEPVAAAPPPVQREQGESGAAPTEPQGAAPAPVEPAQPLVDRETVDDARGSGGKRVVAFWVLLPGTK